MRITCIAVAGTVGALGMLGHRRGGVATLFAAGGQPLAPGASPWGAVLAGLAIHVAWMALWSALFAASMQRWRRLGAAIPALIVAALSFAVTSVAPDVVVGPLATLPTPERTLTHLVLAVSLMLGMRLAPAG